MAAVAVSLDFVVPMRLAVSKLKIQIASFGIDTAHSLLIQTHGRYKHTCIGASLA
jgi:hypothetical protein